MPEFTYQSIIEITKFISIFCLAIMFIFYYYHARALSKKVYTLGDFTLGDRTITAIPFSNTMSASCVSLAVVIVFFVETQADYGLLLILDTIFYLSGQLLFHYTIKKVSKKVPQISSITELWYYLFSDTKLTHLISIIIITSIIAALFVEIYIGSVIVSTLFPDNNFYQSLAYFGIGLLVVQTVKLGGFSAVVYTDTWQFWLIVLASVSVFIAALVLEPTYTNYDLDIVINNIFSFKESHLNAFLFLCWLLVTDLLLPFSQLSNWQRIAATESLETAWKGLISSLWKIGFITLIPLTSFILIRAKGYQYYTLDELLNIILIHIQYAKIILLPLIIIGFAAALLSTADTLVVAFIYALSDQRLLGSNLNNINSSVPLKKKINVIVYVLLLILTFAYTTNNTICSDLFLPVVFALFSQTTILTPLICYALFYAYNFYPSTPFHSKNLFIFLTLAWSIIIGGSVLNFYTQNKSWALASLLLSIFIMIFGLFISFSFNPFRMLQKHKLKIC